MLKAIKRMPNVTAESVSPIVTKRHMFDSIGVDDDAIYAIEVLAHPGLFQIECLTGDRKIEGEKGEGRAVIGGAHGSAFDHSVQKMFILRRIVDPSE